MLWYVIGMGILFLFILIGNVETRDPLEGKDRSSHRKGRAEDDCV